MRKFLAVAAAAAFSALPLEAATINVSSINSAWTGVSALTPATVSGSGSSILSWGTPSKKKTGKSAYGFSGGRELMGVAASYDVDQPFVLGTFTHYNNPIRNGTSITQATLSLAMNLLVDGTDRAIKSTFRLNHWETDNAGVRRICANGGRNKQGVNAKGCADQVKIENILDQTDEFQIGDAMYIMTITGFLVDGVFATEFWTRENAKNTAQLLGKLQKIRDVAPPPPSLPPPAVPLPATAWLVLAGLGGLAGLKRRRS